MEIFYFTQGVCHPVTNNQFDDVILITMFYSMMPVGIE